MIGDVDLDATRNVVGECLAAATNSQFRAEAVQVDVAQEDSVRDIFGRMVEVFGRMDYCVNCAGVSWIAVPQDVVSGQRARADRLGIRLGPKSPAT